MNQKAVIIGAGVGGLATGALLGKMGYDVTILEKNKSIGGHAMQFSQKGFTFDMGPAWYFMPDVFEKYFRLFRKSPRDFYKLKKLDPLYRVFLSGVDFVDIGSSIKENYRVFESVQAGAPNRIRKYLNQAKLHYRTAMDELVYKNYSKISDVLSPALISESMKSHLLESIDRSVSRYTSSDILKKMLLFPVVLQGGSLQRTPALYSLMFVNAFHTGVFYPKGGMCMIVKALESLCEDYNAVIKTGQTVTKIVVAGKSRASAVETKSRKYAADIVISNADYPHTELQLLESKYRSYPATYWEKKTLSPSMFTLYLGIRGKLKKLRHHNLFFTHDGDWYANCPSKSDASVAPTGCENLVIHVPVGAAHPDTQLIRTEYTNMIIGYLEQALAEPIRKRIITKRIFSVHDHESFYNSYRGTAFGLVPTLSQTALLRPANRSKKVKNLYYVGQYTVPGAGVPLCLISGQLVAERIRREQ